VVIDEAAAIPLPLVRAMMGNYLVFLASTVNGYEGTGRSLSLKLIQQLRGQTKSGPGAAPSAVTAGASMGLPSVVASGAAAAASLGGRVLREIELAEPIRYASGDPVESWLNGLLCLDAQVAPVTQCPHPAQCELYYVERDALFSYHAAAEQFLRRLMALFVSYYKNSPNDLQLLSDAPAHHLFVLLGASGQKGAYVLVLTP
jgi:N-acetyltransferase 10